MLKQFFVRFVAPFIALAFLSMPALAQQGHKAFGPSVHTIGTDDLGQVLLVEGGSTILVPEEDIGEGLVRIIKTDNSSNTVRIQCESGEACLNNWRHLVLAIENDSVILYSTGSAWYPSGMSQTPAKGPLWSGVHRTVVASDFPNNQYNADKDDLGGVVRIRTDDSPMVLALPNTSEIGRDQGYSSTTTICAQWTKSSDPAFNVKVFGTGGQAVNGGQYFQLPERGKIYCFNYDSAAWNLIN